MEDQHTRRWTYSPGILRQRWSGVALNFQRFNAISDFGTIIHSVTAVSAGLQSKGSASKLLCIYLFMCKTVFPHFYSRMEPRRDTKREVTATLRRAVKSDSNFRCHVSCCSFWTRPGFDVPPLFLTPLAASLQNKSLRLCCAVLKKGWLGNCFSQDKECVTLWRTGHRTMSATHFLLNIQRINILHMPVWRCPDILTSPIRLAIYNFCWQ